MVLYLTCLHDRLDRIVSTKSLSIGLPMEAASHRSMYAMVTRCTMLSRVFPSLELKTRRAMIYPATLLPTLRTYQDQPIPTVMTFILVLVLRMLMSNRVVMFVLLPLLLPEGILIKNPSSRTTTLDLFLQPMLILSLASISKVTVNQSR